MKSQNTYEPQPRPCLEAARKRAREDMAKAVMPAFAERFPDQFEHAVETVATYRLRELGCCRGEPIFA